MSSGEWVLSERQRARGPLTGAVRVRFMFWCQWKPSKTRPAAGWRVDARCLDGEVDNAAGLGVGPIAKT